MIVSKKSIPASASICLFALIGLSLLSKEVVSEELKCAVILKDLQQFVFSSNGNHKANNNQPMLLQIMLAEPDRREIVKKCEKICKDCPHEGGKMCNCDNYTLDTDDQWPSRDHNYTEPEFDDFQDLDENVEEKPNFYRSK